MKRRDNQLVEWKISPELIDYEQALAAMQARVHTIQAGQTPEQVWLLEHPPLYTLGTSAKESDVLQFNNVPVYKTGRGGQVTYHGPGQRVSYLMLDLQQRQMDLKAYVWTLEEWIINVLKDLGVTALRREGRVGLWVQQSPTRDAKIAAIGVRVQKWVTSHGVALNINPDLKYYEGIIPCGIKDQGVTSLNALGVNVSREEVDQLLQEKFEALF
jgi:lipoyl(octanoyl) transferase